MYEDFDRLLDDIRLLRIQGAKEIAVESLLHLRLHAERHGFDGEFHEKCDKILRVRPTGVAAFNAISEIRKSPSVETIDRILYELKHATERIAENGNALIEPGQNIHTHCHSSTALAVIKLAARTRDVRVIADITEPREQGVKTARELAAMGIPVTLIVDNASGYLMRETDLCLVGADALREEGLVNKTGTYLLALAAADNGVPFYVAASRFKLDVREEIEIEERPAEEVIDLKVPGITVRNPAFDITPWRYVTAVIMEGGVKRPEEVLGMLGRMR